MASPTAEAEDDSKLLAQLFASPLARERLVELLGTGPHAHCYKASLLNEPPLPNKPPLLFVDEEPTLLGLILQRGRRLGKRPST